MVDTEEKLEEINMAPGEKSPEETSLGRSLWKALYDQTLEVIYVRSESTFLFLSF